MFVTNDTECAEMEQHHRDILRKQRPYLVDDITLSGRLYTIMYANELFTKHMIATMKTKGADFQQVQQLLDDVETRGPNAFDLFCDCLIEDGQGHVVEKYLKPGTGGFLGENWLTARANELGQEWEQLAVHLGITSTQADQIKLANPYNEQQQKFRMLKMWSGTLPRNTTKMQCVDELKQALVNSGRRDLAERMPIWNATD